MECDECRPARPNSQRKEEQMEEQANGTVGARPVSLIYCEFRKPGLSCPFQVRLVVGQPMCVQIDEHARHCFFFAFQLSQTAPKGREAQVLPDIGVACRRQARGRTLWW